MDDGTRFDEAWEGWRQELTDALVLDAQQGAYGVLGVLRAVGAFDVEDGLVVRDWALGLMTGDHDVVVRLRAEGMDDAAIQYLIALIQRHPTPAAGS